jgi:flagellar motility protein MotE (MotC chaperone)
MMQAGPSIFSRLRILPLMIVVAVLAFAVRLGDVVIGVRTLEGSAQAETKAEEAKPEEVKKPEDKPAAASAEAPAKTAAAPKAKAPVWKDPKDEDPDFNATQMEVFEDLSERRRQMDQREKEMQTREAMLRAAQKELDQKYQELTQLRQEIEKLLGQQSDEEKARITSLVKIYEGMKPKEAARIFDTLDLDVLSAVMTKMSERKISSILAQMSPERARTITILMAQQKKLPSLPDAEPVEEDSPE